MSALSGISLLQLTHVCLKKRVMQRSTLLALTTSNERKNTNTGEESGRRLESDFFNVVFAFHQLSIPPSPPSPLSLSVRISLPSTPPRVKPFHCLPFPFLRTL